MTFEETLAAIRPADGEILAACQARWDAVAKPLRSLGLLEAQTARIGAVQRTDAPHVKKPRVLVFCADNGVVAEGVSQSDASVTAAVARALAAGSSNVNLMAAHAGAEVRVWDVGMRDDVTCPGLRVAKTANGTANLSRGPAMTCAQAVSALEAGIHAAEEAVREGCDLLIAGEMGIGNTTSSTAVLCALLGAEPERFTGRGSGLSDAGLQRKVAAVRRCLELNCPDPGDPMDVLCKCGGFDIAAMCGVYLSAAANHVPAVLDGLISGAAALLAVRFAPDAAGALLASHVSGEPAGESVLQALGLEAPIHAHMALGEGTGAVALLPLLQLALAVYYGDHSFDAIGVEQYTPQS